MANVLSPDDLNDLLGSLTQPGALIELAVLAACLGLAWGIVRLIRGPRSPEGSIWFGRRIVEALQFSPPLNPFVSPDLPISMLAVIHS